MVLTYKKIKEGSYMRWIDPKFKAHRLNYLAQSLMAILVVFVMSLFMDMFAHTTVIASLGATVFIVFTMPHKEVSRSRYLYGGYTIGLIAGECSTLLMVSDVVYMRSLVMALAVGLAIFLMVVTNTEHPPAAALALGVTVDGANLTSVIVIYSCLTIVLLGKWLMRRWLIDLM